MKRIVMLIVFMSTVTSVVYATTSHTHDAVGLWFTHPSSKGVVDVVEIFEEDGKLYGYGFSHKDPTQNTVVHDVHNPHQDLRHQELTGLIFIYDVAPVEGKKVSKGYIYDPENGQTYYLQIKMKNKDTLVLKPTVDARGVLGPNIKWTRVEEPHIYTPLSRDKLHKPYKK